MLVVCLVLPFFLGKSYASRFPVWLDQGPRYELKGTDGTWIVVLTTAQLETHVHASSGARIAAIFFALSAYVLGLLHDVFRSLRDGSPFVSANPWPQARTACPIPGAPYTEVEMKSTMLGILIGLGLGIAGMCLVGPRVGREEGGSAGPDTSHEGVDGPSDAPISPGPRLVGSPGRVDALSTRLASIEDELRRLTNAVSALTHGAEAEPTKRPPDSASVIPDDVPIDSVRMRWNVRLDKSEELLRTVGPQDERDPVMWSRWEDLKRARRLLEAAHTLDEMRRLSKGEFNRTFKWP